MGRQDGCPDNDGSRPGGYSSATTSEGIVTRCSQAPLVSGHSDGRWAHDTSASPTRRLHADSPPQIGHGWASETSSQPSSIAGRWWASATRED
jgi:hypothetical protein